MKIWKKTLALILAFGMTASITACGGSGKKEPAGEQLEGTQAWAAAWENTLTATNVKAEGYYNYSMYVNEHIWANMESEGVLLLADNKFYSEGYAAQEWDYTGQGQDSGKIDSTTKYYYGMKDGNLCQWFYNEETKAWDEDYAYADSEYFGTAYFLVDEEFGLDMDRYDYLAWESLATYENGVYTLSFAEEDETETYKFKFVDGRLYSFTCIMTDREEGATMTVEQSFTFSYGDAKIGKLPYEAGFGEEEKEEKPEKPDVGGDFEKPDYSDVKGQEMHSIEEWNAVMAATCAETNLTAVGTNIDENGTWISYISIADGKVYMENDDDGVKSYEYMGEVDGVHYEWESKDGENWICQASRY